MPKTGTALTRRDAPIILAMTIAECAAALRVSRSALYLAIRRGEIASYRAGRSRRISLHAAQAYQARLEAIERGEQDTEEEQPTATIERGRKGKLRETA